MHRHARSSEKLTLILLSIIFWSVATFSILYFAQLSAQRAEEQQKDDIQRDLALVRSKIEASIYENIYIADSLATVIQLDPNLVASNWESIADALLNKSDLVRNIGFAPNNVISHVYPLAGNEAAVGFDLSSSPTQLASVMRAKELGWVYLDGPLTLVQGGKALIARFPIFLDFPSNQDYWGSVSVVFKYQQLLEQSGVEELKGVRVALSKESLYNSERRIFYGEPESFITPDIVLPILLPNSEWQLAAQFQITDSKAVAVARRAVIIPSLIGSLCIFISGIILYRAYSMARHVSLQDDLTHLPNRRAFIANMREQMRRSGNSKGFTLLNIDLNDFKAVNDTYGHEAGDALLIHVAKLLPNTLRTSDMVGRIGGDEFLALVNESTSPKIAEQLIDKIHHTFAQRPLLWKGEPILASLSIGYAIFRSEQPVSEEAMLHIADQKMYQNKQSRKEALDSGISPKKRA